MQPLLHHLVGTVLAPTSALSGADGQIRAEGVQGLFHADSRALSQARLLIDGREPEPVGHAGQGPGRTRFVGLARWLGDPGPDPTIRVDRIREVSPGRMLETLEIASTASQPVNATVTIVLSCDFAPIEVVKSGGSATPAVPEASGDRLSWRSGETHVTATPTPPPATDRPASAEPPPPADRPSIGTGTSTTLGPNPAAGGPSAAGPSAAGPSVGGPSAAGRSVGGPGAGPGGPSSGAPGPDGPSSGGPSSGAPGSDGPSSGGPSVGGPGAGGGGAVVEGEGVLRWEVVVAPGETLTLRWAVTVEDPGAVVVAPARVLEWSEPTVRADDHRLVRLATQALDDLRSLRLAETAHPEDTFLGAGVPWFLTVFGRDSIWAARMLLPLGTELAASTLRVLARRQGTKLDPVSGEAPGKIMHELRRHEFATNKLRLPETYYGTIDATPLWITLLHDAWRWGLPEDEVEPLIPALEAALGWLGDHADPDGDGFLEYLDTSGRGLANQGWKDSGDAVRFRDGRQAEPPIALAEVQGYAYAAARHGAALLAAFGRQGGERWLDHADALAERFRARFWTDGGYPALALDRDKRPVDALTSNIGHLLGTGLLSPAEEGQVAAALATPAMSAGFGLRTMSSADRAFSPLSYHCGSVWSHDTAIVIAGLARSGYGRLAADLADGLLAAAETFDFQLPELHAGDSRQTVGRAVAYPAACRPQAWSAAAAVTLLHAAIGIYPDVPAGRVLLRPLEGAPLGAVTVRGLRVAGTEVTASVDRAGTTTITGLQAGVTA